MDRERARVVKRRNVGRSDGFKHDDGMAQYVAKRQCDGTWGKPCSAKAIIAMVAHIDHANENNADIKYTLFCIIPQHYIYGGKRGNLHAYGHEELLRVSIRERLVITPSGIDDDRATLRLLSIKSGEGEALLISNDCFRDHEDAKLRAQHVRYSWVGESNDLLFIPPQGVDLPGL